MSSSNNEKKRKHNLSNKSTTTLNVHEFISALNGDDPTLILQKLHDFVTVVRYERTLALSSSSNDDDNMLLEGSMEDDVDDGGEEESSSDDEVLLQYLFSNDSDDHPSSSSKRQKLNNNDHSSTNNKEPSWTNDTNNYNVPFVGTSIFPSLPSSTTNNLNNHYTANNKEEESNKNKTWPSTSGGILATYNTLSPMGVEILNNDYISALPSSNSGIYKSLLSSSGSSSNDDTEFSFSGNNKKYTKRDDGRQPTKGEIISIAIQTNYWLAVCEYILGYVNVDVLKNEIAWEKMKKGCVVEETTAIINKDKYKCTVPPSIMTILMKLRLPEWINAIHNYTLQYDRYTQRLMKEEKMNQKKKKSKSLQQQQQMKRKSKKDHTMGEEIDEPIVQDDGNNNKLKQHNQQQHREEKLLLSSMYNLIALCHLSIGTAREVLRKLMTINNVAPTHDDAASANTNTWKGKNKLMSNYGRNNKDGTMMSSWMVQLFQQTNNISSTTIATSCSYRPQIQCLKLVNVLMETKDYTILSRLCEIPSPPYNNSKKQQQKGGGSNNSSSKEGTTYKKEQKKNKNVGLIYVALRYGIQNLLVQIGEKSTDKTKISAAIDNSMTAVDVEEIKVLPKGRGKEKKEMNLYAQYVIRLLRNVIDILLPSSSNSSNNGSSKEEVGEDGFVIGHDVTAELLSGDVLINLTKLSFHAPHVDDATNAVSIIQDIINGNIDNIYDDNNEIHSPIQVASIEAQRLIFILLSDTSRSPFLYGIHNNKKRANKTTGNKPGDDKSEVYLSHLSKSLHALLVNYGQHDQLMKMLLGSCLNTTPNLVPHFFRGLQLVDPKLSTTYKALALLTFVESVVRDAPIVSVGIQFNNNVLSAVDQLLPTIVPSCVTKNLLGKVIQSSSPLLVSSGLKLIITVLRRAHDVIISTTNNNEDGSKEGESQQLKSLLSHKVMRFLPEVNLLLSLSSRFDPFESQVSESPRDSTNGHVVLQMCEALQCYAKIDNSWIANVKFNWTKLIPNEEEVDDDNEGLRMFSNAEPILQHRILQTLLMISRFNQTPFSSSKMMLSALSIVVSTKVPEVYKTARQFAIMLMERELFSHVNNPSSNSSEPEEEEDSESRQCNKYEISLWVDGISPDLIQELVLMIETTKQRRVQNKIMISQAWLNASMGCSMPASFNISSLLLSSICQLIGDNNADELLSQKMSLLLVQITTKMLLFQVDPKPFAAIIVHCTQGGTSIPSNEKKYITSLYRVAKGILHDEPKTSAHIESLISEVFLPESHLNYIARLANNTATNHMNNILQSTDTTTLRQCLSLIRYSGGDNENIYALIRKILIGIVERGNEDVAGNLSRLLALFNSQVQQVSPDMESNMLLLLSAVTRSKQSRSEESVLDCDAGTTNNESTTSMKLVSELLRCSLIPTKYPSTFTADICKFCLDALQSKNAEAGFKGFLLFVLLHILPSTDDDLSISSSSLPPGTMLDLWATLAGNLSSKVAVECCLRLEDCLIATFDGMTGQGAWDVYQRILHNLTPQLFVDLSWKTVQERAVHENVRDTVRIRESSQSFLRSILEYDCSEFSNLSSLFASMGKDAKLVKIWECGCLDAVAATFMLQSYKQKGAKAVIKNESFGDAASVIGKRFATLLKDHHHTSLARVSVEMMLDLLDTLCSNHSTLILDEAQQSFLEVFDQLDNNSLTISIDLEIKLMELATRISSQHNKGYTSSMLLTRAFTRCCKVLPMHLKALVRTNKKGDAERWWKMVDERSALTRRVEGLVNIATSLIEIAQSFDKNAAVQSSDVIDRCVIACLKYGIMESSDTTSSAFGSCLRFIRLLMLKTHGPTSRNISLGSLTPSQIHIMAVSHSSFESTLSNGQQAVTTTSVVSGDKHPTQHLELIQLLLCTISLESHHVKIEDKTRLAILSVYNVSTTVVDQLLRRLMFIYEQNDCYEDEIMMNDLRWGPTASKQINSNANEDESWVWLVHALELDRVMFTLSQFPVADSLEPESDSGIEGFQNKQAELIESSNDAEDEIEDDDRSADVIICTTKKIEVRNDEWRGSGNDLRYSPGFILPLILSAIEAHLPHEDLSHKTRKGNEEEASTNEETIPDDEDIARCRSYVNFCRKLGDRGGIALAIASLSSRCPTIRRVAVAICGLFLKALQMPESRDMKMWHERPQQEMIMASIQRGLAVRRSIQIQKYKTQGGIELGGAAQRYNVPMLPAISAVFLAKAMLVLSNPRHEMYGQMNRYFLRLEEYHGAFQDCFGLPVFLSMYCSSSDELSRCKAERNWALQSLKDGVVDEYCYRIISQHHVPELIMSSFDGLLDSPAEGKSELQLTIEVIESLLKSGGTRASNHLIERQGLLSWLHGIISWRAISSTFPDVASKCKFLNLVTTAAESYRCIALASQENEKEDPTVFYEMSPLANAVIRICLNGGDHSAEDDGDPSSAESSIALIESTCNALWAIYLADKESKAFSSQGSTSLSEMASLLRKFVIHGTGMFEKVLTVVCHLPLALAKENDLKRTKLFCDLALAFVLEKRMKLLPDTFIIVMKRVNELMKLHPSLQNDKNMISEILSCRNLAVIHGCIGMWNSLISTHVVNSV